MRQIRRGDVYYANLTDDTYGHEQRGSRPVVVVQGDKGNRISSVVIVAPMTGNLKEFPTNVFVESSKSGLYDDSMILVGQIRAIDKRRLERKIGYILPDVMAKVDEVLEMNLGIKTEDKGGESEMKKLTVINHNGQFTIDSREVAEMTGVRHCDLLEKIQAYSQTLDNSENGIFRSLDFFIPHAYSVEGNTRPYPCYLLTRKGCDMVANKTTGEKGVLFTAEYVTRFEEMEKALKPKSTLEALQETVKVLSEHEQRLDKLDKKVDNEIRITYNQAKEVQFTVAGRVIELLGGKGTKEYRENKNSYFRQLHHDIKDRLGVPSYRDIRRIDNDAALAFIKAWLPRAEDKSLST